MHVTLWGQYCIGGIDVAITEETLHRILENQEEIKQKLSKLEQYNQHEIFELNHITMQTEETHSYIKGKRLNKNSFHRFSVSR